MILEPRMEWVCSAKLDTLQNASSQRAVTKEKMVLCFRVPIFDYEKLQVEAICNAQLRWKKIRKKEVGKLSPLAFIISGIIISGVCAVVPMIGVTKVAKSALDKALAENEDIDGITSSSSALPIVAESSLDLNQPLIINIDSTQANNHEK